VIRLFLVPPLLAAACSSGNLDPGDGSLNTPTDVSPGGVQLRIDVLPASVREGTDVFGDFRVLPQTFLPPRLTTTDLSVGAIELLAPREQTGTVVGYRTNPEIALIPGAEEPVDATVWLRAPGTTQSTFTVTDALGAFSMWVVPQSAYRLEVIPTDPLFPAWATDLSIAATPVPQEIDLGPGVPVYGRVSSASGPVVGARIHVVDADGMTSSTAETDAYGLYQVRVTPGDWTVVCEGRGLGLDPTLTVPTVEVGLTGANVDLTYPTLLQSALVEGHLDTESGTSTAGTIVRFTAETLFGFEDVGVADGVEGVTATWTGETPVSEAGTILTRVVPGLYTVEVLPPSVNAGVEFSPERLTGETFSERPNGEANQLGSLMLSSLVNVSGRALTNDGRTVADAVITCVETGFDHRFWTTVVDADGDWSANLPETVLACELTPPSGRGLAIARSLIDPTTESLRDFLVPDGEPVTGTVTFDGLPELFAVVNVYDLDGTLLGFGITGADGAFSIPVDLEDLQVTD
jgi:hypothetical protein